MKLAVRITILVLAALVLAAGASVCSAQDVKLLKEEFSFHSSFDNTGPLLGMVIYAEKASKYPMMVVQHGYGGSRENVVYSAERMARRGYFCVLISTRGWGGSAGANDDGGIEIMDIYDGMHFAAKKYAGKVDISKASIVGYSNGGANAYFATVRFPYLFRASLAFFGISDYGKWITLQEGFKPHVVKAVGGTPQDLPDKYMARNAVLAAGNLSGTRFHIAYDADEKLCPIEMNTAFLEAARNAGYQDIFVHASNQNDQHRWHHGYNTNGHLSPIEDLFMDDIEKTKQPRPVMPPAGKLAIIGFAITPRFRCVLGNGDDAVATLDYDLRNGSAHFRFTPHSSNPKAKAHVTLLQNGAPCDIEVLVNGERKAVIPKGGKLETEATIDCAIEFREKK